jgi:hypothetical protein
MYVTLAICFRCDIESVLAAILRSIFSLEASNPGLNSHREIINVFLNAAKFSKVVEGAAEKSMSFEDFRSWCALLPSVRKFLGSLLIPPDAGFLSFFLHIIPIVFSFDTHTF